MMKTKTEKTPLMMAAAFGPASCSSGLVLKSELLHSPEAQSGFVPKHSLHGGKNLALRAKKPNIAMRRGYFYSKEPRNQGNNIPKFSDLKGTECGVAIPDSLDNKITRSFFSEAVFLLTSVCDGSERGIDGRQVYLSGCSHPRKNRCLSS
jgi:hypothetical protein